MKRKVIKFLIILFGIIFILGFYFNTSYFIENQNWKYSSGYHIGDWFSKKSFQIDNRKINGYRGEARIIFSFGKSLWIENPITKENGFYTNKNFNF